MQSVFFSFFLFPPSTTLQALKDRVLSTPGLAKSLPCGVLQPHTAFCLFSKYLSVLTALILDISGVFSPLPLLSVLSNETCSCLGNEKV